MDWYSWLSKTNIDPTLVYEYGLAFIRNELQEEDLSHFDHEFLQSIGISIAKHRLEILKLARKEARGRMNGLSRLVLAMSRTKKLLTKNIIGKWGIQKTLSRFPSSDLSPYRNQWSGALKRFNGASKESHQQQQQQQQEHKAMVCSRSNVMWSGPLDRRMQEKFMLTGHSVSGPLDGKMMLGPNWSPLVKDKMGFFCKSPTINGPVERWGLSPKVNSYCGSGGEDDDAGVQSLWSLMFQDMKPT